MIRTSIVAGCLFLLMCGAVDAPIENIFAPHQKIESDKIQLNTLVRDFLLKRKSPLAKETDFLLTLEHWELIIAISAIESQYCRTNNSKHNCWGIMYGDKIRKFYSYKEGAQYTNDLIARRRSMGKWLTVESMNCSYVVPCNNNWVSVVKNNINILNELSK